jgi:lysophospholipase L1-like esterase
MRFNPLFADFRRRLFDGAFRRTLFHLPACFCLLVFSVGQCQPQLRPPFVEFSNRDTVQHGFIDTEKNGFENAEYLAPLFQKMHLQRTQGGHKVSILHIGDSHILGNYLTREVRRRLQESFGDAGRGLVFPYRLADSNGPRDYLVSAEGSWDGDNCNRNQAAQIAIGIAGFRLETSNPKASLTFRLRDTASAETDLFTKVTVFQPRTDHQFDLEVSDEISGQEAQILIESDFSRSYYFDRPVGQVTLQPKRTTPTQKKLTIDGISLENEYAGVIYHSVGVNGATYEDYTRARHFAKGVADLYPDLVILSFGTNEAQGHTTKGAMRRSIDQLVRQIQEQSPTSLLLLTTPADSYLRGKGFNPYMAEMSGVIRAYAKEKGLALWDLYRLSGGENSAQSWKTRGLMAGDSVHYSKSGYIVQGKLLYQSIIKGYNEYVTSQR